MERWNKVLAVLLGFLVALTIGVGLYFEHYFVVCVFGLWFSIEFVLWRYRLRFGSKLSQKVRFYGYKHLLDSYERMDAESAPSLLAKIRRVSEVEALTVFEKRWLDRLRCLVELKSLVEGWSYRSPWDLALTYQSEDSFATLEIGETFLSSAVKDLPECATRVADLYWKLYDSCLGDYVELTVSARMLFQRIFRVNYSQDHSRAVVEQLTDTMQRYAGVPFALMNLWRREQDALARSLTQQLLREESFEFLDEEMRTALYWVGEIHWFLKHRREVVTDHEAAIRFLYHLVFVGPEGVGFLEIDSRFLNQFEAVNELAREGFLFKELLIERTIELWKEFPTFFDVIFQKILEVMTGQVNKIYGDWESWNRFWLREREEYCKEHLYVVEANLCYAGGHYKDACLYYEKALAIDPSLRSARLNLLFAYAKAGRATDHNLWANRLVEERDLMPEALYVVGNSYLLVHQSEQAQIYFERLRPEPGWADKIDYYVSIFCFENGLFEEALKFAKAAYERVPQEAAIRYHLSLCFDAMGEKQEALGVVKDLSGPQWLKYYRFTLERDAGNHQEASETLLSIPTEYFEDPEELESALDFAKGQQNLVLLRHLKRS